MQKCRSYKPDAYIPQLSQLPCGALPTFLESNLPLIQKYLLSDNPSQILESIEANTQPYYLLKLLNLSPSSAEFREIQQKLTKQGVEWVNDLFLIKVPGAMKNGQVSENDKVELLKKCQEKLMIDFDQYIEPASISVGKTIDNPNKLTSGISKEDFSILEYLKFNKAELYRTITRFGLKEYGVENLLKLEPNEGQCRQILNSIYTSGEIVGYDDQVIPIMKYFFNISRENYQAIEPYQNLLTLDQLHKLSKQIPEIITKKEYIKILYEKIHEEKLKPFLASANKQLTSDEKKRKHDILIEAKTWLSSFNLPLIRTLIYYLNYEIVSLQIEMKKYDLSLFFEYLDNPIESSASNYFNQNQQNIQIKNRSKAPQKDNYWRSLKQFQSCSFNTDSFVQKFIISYFQNEEKPEIELLEKYFERKKVQEWYGQVRLARGDSLAAVGNVFDYERLEQMRNQKHLSFVENSKFYFEVDDPVVLKLKIKNIEEVTAEIYEINTEKHYLGSDAPINDHIAVDFIEPYKKVTKAITVKSQFKYQILEFDLSTILENKNSIYIIDFVGAQKYCRAVIRKGLIVCIEKLSIAGIELEFYEENGKKIQNLDIWIENKKIPVIDKYVIPYREKAEIVKIVAVKNSFASLHKVRIPTEEYDFKMNYIFDRQNFIIGNKAKILLQARLELHGLPATMEIVKETVITVNIVNNQGINTSFDLRNIKWNYKNQFELEIPIQNPVAQIRVTIKTKVEKYKGQKKIEKNFTINFNPDMMNQTVSFFLTKDKEEYLIRALGTNAEPKPNLTATIVVDSLLFNGQQYQQYITDEKGQIKLGNLRNIQKLSIQAKDARQQNWNFSKIKQTNYSNKIITRANEEINLPVYSGFSLDQVEILYFGERSKLIKRVQNNIKLKDERLIIKLQEQGDYVVNFLTINKKINVLVRNGVFWHRTSQLYSKQKKQVLVCYPQAHNYIGLSEKIEVKQENSKYKVKCQLTSPEQINRESIRVHVFASYFKYNNDIDKLRNNYVKNIEPVKIPVELPKSNYINNQCLSEQHCYILNREKAKKYIGNSLEKPRILLGRTETKETNDSKDQSGRPINYGATSTTTSSVPGATRYTTQSAYHRAEQNYESINPANRFLKYNSLIIPNLNQKEIEFEIPKHYKNIRVLVTSQSFAIEKEFDLSNTELETKDLRHFGLNEKQNNIGLTMSRNCYKLRKGESLKVNRNSIWAIISGQNIYSYSRTKNQLLKGWVMNWESYDLEKKKEVYSKNICHEINTFIKYKDEEFFNSVVKPFLSNKLEKTVVDYCLLEDENALKYLDINKLELLNPFQKCLLVDFLVKIDKIAEAQALTNSLKLKQKSKSTSYQQYEKLFDTAINCKLSQDNQQLPSNATMIQNQAQEMYFQQQQQVHQPYAHQFVSNDFAYNAPPLPPPGNYPPVAMYSSNQIANDAMLNAGFGGGMFGNVFPTYSPVAANVNNIVNRLNMNMSSNAQVRVEQQALGNIQLRNQYKKGFTEIQKTKQYIETTYHDMKNPSLSTNHVHPSQFWVQLAQHFLQSKTTKQQFLSQSFIYLNSKVQFTLAFSFISNAFNSKYSLKSEEDEIIITAQTSFLVFIKQVKNVQYKKRSDIVITQHFYDPQDEFIIDQDGQRIEKTITQFIKNKPYCVKTIITNISQSNLQLQILIDIPSGSIPIDSEEYTQIKSELINSYSIRSYAIKFYFPQSGTFKIYPSNVSKKGEVIAKAEPFGNIVVKDELILENLNVNNLQSILTSGTLNDVLNFVKEKNIFDNKIFNLDSIMWMLKDKQFFKNIIQILKSRLYYNQNIWSFSLLHNDVDAVNEYLENRNQFKSKLMNNLSIFEYHPLSSKRVHKHLKGFKNQILNESFKVTYENFLLSSFITKDLDNPVYIIVFTYYLILQDRIEEAELVFKRLKSITKSYDFPEIQHDYISSFLDIYTGYPNFAVARELSAKYKNYPIQQWRDIFKDIDNLLNNHDTLIYEEDQIREYEIKFINKGKNLRILLPEKTSLELNLFAINLELFFSSTPFDAKNIVISVQPFQTIRVQTKDGGQQKIQKPDQYPDIYVIPTETSATKSGQILAPFLWNNDSVKVKLLEDNGTAIVFVDGKPKPGTYCKVYAKSNNGSIDFYKDGYTDLQGKFVYAASELSEIDKFAILFKTDKGGVIKHARKPNAGGVFAA